MKTRTRIPAAAIMLLLIGACSDTESPTKSAPAPAPASKAKGAEVRVIATGAELAGANGIHFGPDGLLYIASVVGSDITAIDPETGETEKHYTAADGVTGPDDLAFGPDGSLYWTSIMTGEVAGLTPQGRKIIAANLGPGVNPITFSDDGRLFVAQCFLGDKVYEVDPRGVEEPRLISDELGPGCGLNGMDWGPDNRLYGPRWFTGEIVSFDVDDNTLRVEASGFQTPAAVKFDAEGRLNVLDTGTGEVVRVEGDKKTVLATLTPGLDNLAFDDRDRIFVSSFVDGFVKRIDKEGTTTLKPAGMSYPGGLTVQNGNIVLADLYAIRAFDPAGKPLFVQRDILGVGKMGGALNIAADGEDLILTSWFDNDVRIWNPGTQKLKARFPDMSLPVSAIRYHGNVVVAQHGKHRVVVLGEDGGQKVIADNLPAPTGLVTATDNLYVGDRELGQILLIAKDGEPLATPTVIVKGLTTPEGFVVTAKGFIVVEADPGRVVKVNAAGDRRILANIPPGSQAASDEQPPSQVFNGIAMLNQTTLFVSGESNRSLYRIDLTDQDATAAQ